MKKILMGIFLPLFLFFFFSCKKAAEVSEDETAAFEKATGLSAEVIFFENISAGIAPVDFEAHTGAVYKPSYNEDPAIPVQCWVETGYGTQNACKYCHTNHLAEKKHGNNLPLAEDQILYSFPSPNLNKVNWKNITHPEDINRRLKENGIEPILPENPENLDYVRTDNWRAAYHAARPDGDDTWNNLGQGNSEFQLFPALNPDNLFPYKPGDPTWGGEHGYIDEEGFVRNKEDIYTGWRAVNFFPYAIFTPLTGSVSGIYIRLPRDFMTKDGKINVEIYKRNLDLLEKNIKNEAPEERFYFGDAGNIEVIKGFYPFGTEFGHPLHYVDLNADGETGRNLDGVKTEKSFDYEFPGTRSKRVKEIRYMYKWKDVRLEDDEEEEASEQEAEEPKYVIGKEWKGWIDNGAGWILAAFIENRSGDLRPQTTEELLQCLGCHSSVGNTIDAVWSFQRKIPGGRGWGEMDYGDYKKSSPGRTRLQDYEKPDAGMGELAYFYYTVVGADLFGVMPEEIKRELLDYARKKNLGKKLGLTVEEELIFDDEALKTTDRERRKKILEERAEIMRHYALSQSYLALDAETGEYTIKGFIFYPLPQTMRSNIAGYRRIVLDQSFNLGKNVFGSQPESIPFTFRSDGTILDGEGNLIPLGAVIESRPWGEDGVGITPTGIVKVNEKGEPVDAEGNVVDINKEPEKAVGHVSTGGTFETRYNPIIKRTPVKKKK
ncbi:MAG: hypothetical protein JXB26_12745 [Candidatus Aminicenantes bacterium]|nr:hypothetical protein [Candidatus Aminicenantes bacterium]